MRICYRENITSGLSRNSEVSTSTFLENLVIVCESCINNDCMEVAVRIHNEKGLTLAKNSETEATKV